MPNICPLRPTCAQAFYGVKVQRRAQMISVGRKTVYETDPRYPYFNFLEVGYNVKILHLLFLLELIFIVIA